MQNIKNFFGNLWNRLTDQDKWLDDSDINNYINKHCQSKDINIKSPAGNDELSLFLEDKDLFKEHKTVLIPVCLKGLFGLANHWTFLEIKQSFKGDFYTATLHDSKKSSSIFRFFATRQVHNIIKEKFGVDKTTFEQEFYGHQKNSYDCGRFVLGYIEQKIANPDKLKCHDPSNEFSKINNRIAGKDIQPEIKQSQPQSAVNNQEQSNPAIQPEVAEQVGNIMNSADLKDPNQSESAVSVGNGNQTSTRHTDAVNAERMDSKSNSQSI